MNADDQRDPLRLLKIEEAAAILGIADEEVSALVKQKRIVAYPVGKSGQPRIPRLALERFVLELVEGRGSVARQFPSHLSSQIPARPAVPHGVARGRTESGANGR